MYKTLKTFVFAIAAANAAQAAGPSCKAPPEGTPLPERYSYQVAGTGRLYLHRSPNEQCADKRLFVVPGDSLTAFSDYGPKGEWTYVTYFSKNGDDASGWVLTKRLMFTGAMGPDMSPADIEYYKKAAAAAKAGKLGAP